MNIDGFNQKNIGGVLFNRVNNSKRPDGTWIDPELSTMLKTYKASKIIAKKVERKADKIPKNLSEPGEDLTKEELKIIDKQIAAFKDKNKNRYDIYIQQGNPIQTTVKLAVQKDEIE